MRKVLWLTAEVPDQNLGGASIREFYLLTEMAKNASCDLVTPTGFSDATLGSSLGSVMQVDGGAPATDRGFADRAGDLWWMLTGSDPVEVRDNRVLRLSVERLGLDYDAYDAVVVEHAGLASLLPPRRANRWVLNICQLNSRRAEHELPLTPPGRRRWLVERNVARARRFESWAATAYDAVAVASPEDADALPGAPLLVPNGVDLDRYIPTPLPAGHGVIFLGSLNTLANVDGVQWLCEEVWPLVRARIPHATLDIVGKKPVAQVKRLADAPSVTIHADVPSVGPFLESARVAVVPLRIGSGTRLKALEAMASGRPVVGTSIGLEGLDLTRNFVAVADDAEAFARATVELLQDDRRANDLARAGRAEVEANFGWGAIASRFSAAVLEPGG